MVFPSPPACRLADRLWRGAATQTHSHQPEAVLHQPVPLSPTFTPSPAGLPDSAAGGGAEMGAGVGGAAGGVVGGIEGELQQLEMKNYLLLPFRPVLVAVRGRQTRFLRGNPQRESGQHTDQSLAYVAL